MKKTRGIKIPFKKYLFYTVTYSKTYGRIECYAVHRWFNHEMRLTNWDRQFMWHEKKSVENFVLLKESLPGFLLRDERLPIFGMDTYSPKVDMYEFWAMVDGPDSMRMRVNFLTRISII
jgi:hypothetical protein